MLLNSEIPKAPIVIKKIPGKPTVEYLGHFSGCLYEINEETGD